MLKFTVELSSDKMNVGRYLRQYCSVSARTLAKLKRVEGGILLNGSTARSIDPVSFGDEILLNLPENSSQGVEAIEMELDILFEDDYIVAVNKPPFMPVHPTKQHQTDTLANGLKFYAEQKGESYVFRAVNRLDRNTSGIVIVAKNRHISYALTAGKIQKYYTALCSGNIIENGTVDKPMDLADDSKMVRVVRADGKRAITHYKALRCFKDFTLVELTLETGRTHQIRCHMAYLGHSLLGDDLYGGSLELINRHALHCGKVSFIHPVTQELLTITAPLPKDMENLIKN